MPTDDELLEVLEESKRRGFLGPGPVGEHVAHAERALSLLDEVVPPTGRCVDLGSGGGVPGLVLARRRSSWSWVLLDAQQRRTDFLLEAVRRLDLSARVEVLRARAETVGRDPMRRGIYDAVVARSFGPPAVVAECGAPLLKSGGMLMVSEPPDDGADVTDSRWPVGGLSELGLERRGPARDGWMCLHLTAAVPDRYPRADGRPAKRPLW